jgi:hypothetical protein
MIVVSVSVHRIDDDMAYKRRCEFLDGKHCDFLIPAETLKELSGDERGREIAFSQLAENAKRAFRELFS